MVEKSASKYHNISLGELTINNLMQLKVINACGKIEFSDDEYKTFVGVDNEMCQLCSFVLILGYFNDICVGGIIGGLIDENTLTIKSIAVLPAYQGLGVG